ncbi:hypothetical protein SAMN00790413_02743 [Deinococcus hopiensis KR-140]|uniref:Uncharacterized protein n=1 Tax=Deinococcus hopiensis KR-140 TaxID=695939 RepID=A0A1W1VPG6_9DEIO|nr:hypothetical protein SAMN00790413_02743 [Deinococcus hopiensis KR-140]
MGISGQYERGLLWVLVYLGVWLGTGPVRPERRRLLEQHPWLAF